MIFAANQKGVEVPLLGIVAAFVGDALLISGLAFYAKYKNQHPVWGLVGGMGCIGLVILAALPDRHGMR